MKQIIKRCAGCLLLLLVVFVVHAQPNIVKVEYYFDTDPGYGKATAFSITPGTNLSNLALNLNPASFPYGVHVMGIRAQDANGAWSLDNKWIFARPYPSDTTSAGPPPSLKRVEYYFDNDPGYNNATAFSITPGSNLSNLVLNINPATLTYGVHVMGIRAEDSNGVWGLDNKWIFARPYPSDTTGAKPAPNLKRVEYYLDNDPGYGSGIAVSFSPGSNLSGLLININTDSIAQGVHVLGIRAQDSSGAWALDNKWLFAKPYASDTTKPAPAPNLSQVEYYIDTDPGYGNGVPVAINKVTGLANFNMPINITGLAAGNHKLFMRSKDANGRWSLDNRYAFKVGTALTGTAIVVNSVTRKTLCARDSFSVSYQVNPGTSYNPGNVFNVQLSDTLGNFGSPITIGSYTGTGNSIIPCQLPSHLSGSNLYRVRIVSTNPGVTGVTGSDSLTIHNGPYAQTIIGAANANATFTYEYSVPYVAGSTWAWTAPAATVSPTADSASLLWNTAGTQTVKALETNQYGCTDDTSSAVVNVYPLLIDSVGISSLTPCPSSTITVTAKASGVYNAGNVFTAQLSNASGSFSAPVSIGSVTATTVGNQQPFTINASLPYPLVNGTGYRIRVVAASPVVNSTDNGQNITVQKPNLGNDTTLKVCPGIAVNLDKVYDTSGNVSKVWNTARPDSITASGSYTLTVTNLYGCMDTATATVVLRSPTVPAPTISPAGPLAICQGTVDTLTASAGFAAYQWSTNATTQKIGVGSAASYTVTVTDTGGCKGTSAPVVVTINPLIPTPGAITGIAANLCSGGSYKYSIAAVAGAASYTWSVPATCTISTGQGTISIKATVPASFSSGTVSVLANGACPSGVASTLAITGKPAVPAKLTGPKTVAANQTGVIFSVPYVAGLTHTWTVPTGAVITAGQGTDSITVTWGTVAGSVSVKAVNSCGSSILKKLAVKLGAGVELNADVNGKTEDGITLYPNPSNGISSLVFTATQQGKYSLQVMDMTGRKLFEKEGLFNAGQNKIDIDVSKYAGGMYFVNLIDDEHGQRSLKLVKQQ